MWLISLLLFLLHFCLAITFFVSGLIINCVQCVLYVTIQPINPALFKWINYYLHWSICAQIVFVAEWWSSSDCRLHVSSEDLPFLGREHALLVMNHTYEIDWLMGWIIAERCGVLGSAKVFLKDVLRYVPVVGWSWSFSNLVFLRRNWRDDQKHVDDQLNILADYPYPVWMLIFCEGTRFTVDKHYVSMGVARAKGFPELRNLLLPRPRGFTHTVSRLRHKFAAIYDLTVEFDTKNYAQPTLTNMIRRRPIRGDIHVRRIPMSDLPSPPTRQPTTATTTEAETAQLENAEEKALTNYLFEIYRYKDEKMSTYRANRHSLPATFSDDSAKEILDNVWRANGDKSDAPTLTADNTRAHILPRRLFTLLNTCAWLCVVFVGVWRLVLVKLAQVHGEGVGWMAIALAAGVGGVIALLSLFGLRKLVNLTKISRSSSYGQKQSDTNK
nr:AGPAT3-like protein [Parasacculina yatsui]